MPPTLYIPVAPPSPLPALTAETEIQLFPSPISVLDTEFIPPMDRPSSRKSLRSRASVPRAQSPSQSNLDNAPSYKRSPSVFSDDGMSSLTSFHSDSEDSGDIANHSDEDEGTHDFSMPKVAAREMSIFSFFGAGETEGDEQEASVYRVVDPDKSKIPAPTGGAGRPGSGGYSLREQLGWDADQLNNLRILAARLVEDLLDETKSITHQDSRNMIRARHEGAKAMPELNKYAGEWPLVGAIQSKLKYTSSRAREASKKGVSKKILEAAKEAEVPVLAKRPPVSRGRSRVRSPTPGSSKQAQKRPMRATRFVD